MRIVIENRVTKQLVADYTLPDGEPVSVDLNLPATPNAMSPDLLLRIIVVPTGMEVLI